MPFVKGQSGNPSGRPRGSKDRYTKFREMVEGDTPDIIRKVVQIALDGDLAAARIILDRVWPQDSERELELRDEMAAIMTRLDQLESK